MYANNESSVIFSPSRARPSLEIRTFCCLLTEEPPTRRVATRMLRRRGRAGHALASGCWRLLNAGERGCGRGRTGTLGSRQTRRKSTSLVSTSSEFPSTELVDAERAEATVGTLTQKVSIVGWAIAGSSTPKGGNERGEPTSTVEQTEKAFSESSR